MPVEARLQEMGLSLPEAPAPMAAYMPAVRVGTSELLEHLFGERGCHARSVVAANELPFGIPVEIEMIAEVET